jgi:hypothetical protein
MINVSVRGDVKEVKKKLTLTQRKQIPFALSNAINEVSFQAQRAEKNALRRYIDRPNPYTVSGIQVWKSGYKKGGKNYLNSSIVIPDSRAYMKNPIEGGVSKRRSGHSIPINKSLENKYGSLPRNKAKTLTKKKGHFKATINGRAGVWKRDKNGLSLEILFKDTITTRKSYPVWTAAQRVVEKKFKHVLDDKLAYALKTAR